MENTNKKELPRNRPKEDMIPCQPSPNDSKDFMSNPLKKKKQFSEEDNQNIVQNEISS